MNFGNTIRLNKTGSVFLAVVLVLILYYTISNSQTVPYELEHNNGNIDLQRLLVRGINAAVAGGKKVLQVYNSSKLNVKSKGLTKEGANNPVTDADLLSHCVMFSSLKDNFPGATIISEERDAQQDCTGSEIPVFDPSVVQNAPDLPNYLVPAADVTIWIDPLDATQEFTENLVNYVTTMVCVAVKGVPVIGIIHFPFSGETTWAWVGKHMPVKPSDPPNKIKVITSRSHKGDVTKIVQSALGKDVEMIQAGGAGYKSLQVAASNVTAYIHTTNIKKWDICAGDAILQALEGKMTTLAGKEISYGDQNDVVNKEGLLATLKGHEKFVQALNKILPKI